MSFPVSCHEISGLMGPTTAGCRDRRTLADTLPNPGPRARPFQQEPLPVLSSLPSTERGLGWVLAQLSEVPLSKAAHASLSGKQVGWLATCQQLRFGRRSPGWPDRTSLSAVWPWAGRLYQLGP